MTLPARPKIPSTPDAAGSKAATRLADPPDEDANPRKLRGQGGLLSSVWPILCLFQLGLVAGLYSSSRQGSPEQRHEPVLTPTESGHPSGERSPADTTATAANAPAAHAPADTTQADNYLQRGWYEHALVRYESFAAAHSGEMSSALRFKRALCLDGLGQWDRALAEYGEIAGRGMHDRTETAARFARARLWFRMRNIGESKLAIADLLLRSSESKSAGGSNITELSHLLALTLAMDALGTDGPGPHRENTLAFPGWSLRPEAQLLLLEEPAGEMPEKGQPVADHPDVLDVWPTGPAIHDCDVTVTAHRASASDIIQRVADSANVHCVWTDAARDVANRRTIDLATSRLAWPVLMTSLTEPLQIVWEFRDDQLCLCTSDELGDDDRLDRRAAVAKLILSATIREGRRSRGADVAYLALGILEFAQDEPSLAVNWFERLAKEFPRSPQSVQAHFNLGVVRRSMGETEASRSAFFHAVDLAPAHPLAPLAHLYVGRMYLDQFQPEAALAPLRRAVLMSAASDVRPCAVIDLVAAMMLAKNWRGAAAALSEHAALLDQPELRATAAFLEAYARFRLIGDQKQSLREGQALVAALMGMKSESAMPECGVLLVGRAYAELGLSEQMARTFKQALKLGLPKSVADEITCDLAEFAHVTGKGDEAVRLYAGVFAGSQPGKSHQAGMRIAEISLAARRNDDCLRYCRQMLDDAGKDDAPEILRLMGRAYEQSGDHQRAAQCFAGRAPSE